MSNSKNFSPDFSMAGTTTGGGYTVVAIAPLGRIGYKNLGNQVRVRLEPAGEHASSVLGPQLSGWKQPDSDGGIRFSTVVPNGAAAVEAIERGLAALGLAGVQYNPAAAGWQEAVGDGSDDPPDEGEYGGESEPETVAVPAADIKSVAEQAAALAEALRALRG